MLMLKATDYTATSRAALYGLLEKFRVFLIPDFLSSQECARLRRGMDAARTEEPYHSIHKNLRHHCVRPETDSYVRGRFAEILPRMERHFGGRLAFEGPMEYSTYSRGGFLSLHSDALKSTMCPYDGRRIAACTVYLSSESPKKIAGCHQGGALMLHNLSFKKRNSGRKKYSLALPAQAGLLIAFDVKLPHEVRPILSGARYSIVARFIAA